MFSANAHIGRFPEDSCRASGGPKSTYLWITIIDLSAITVFVNTSRPASALKPIEFLSLLVKLAYFFALKPGFH